MERPRRPHISKQGKGQRPSKKKKSIDPLYYPESTTAGMAIVIEKVKYFVDSHAMEQFHKRILGRKFKFSGNTKSEKHEELSEIILELVRQSKYYAHSKWHGIVKHAVYVDTSGNPKDVFFILTFIKRERCFKVITVYSLAEHAESNVQEGRWVIFEESDE